MSLIVREHHASLFIGDVNTIKDSNFLKNDLEIKCLINCSCDLEFPDPPQNFDNFAFVEKRVPIENFIGVYIIPLLEHIVDYIHKALVDNKQNVLIYSFNGRSRASTFVIAYMMKIRNMTLRDSLDELEHIHPRCQPNESFIHQLMIFEKALCGEVSIQVKIRPLGSSSSHDIGSRVRVKSTGLCGTVRYIGHTKFAEWELIGLQMDYPSDEFHDGRGYFEVPAGCGLFVRRHHLEINTVISQYECPI